MLSCLIVKLTFEYKRRQKVQNWINISVQTKKIFNYLAVIFSEAYSNQCKTLCNQSKIRGKRAQISEQTKREMLCLHIRLLARTIAAVAQSISWNIHPPVCRFVCLFVWLAAGFAPRPLYLYSQRFVSNQGDELASRDAVCPPLLQLVPSVEKRRASSFVWLVPVLMPQLNRGQIDSSRESGFQRATP
jgi:hypothetical protein